MGLGSSRSSPPTQAPPDWAELDRAQAEAATTAATLAKVNAELETVSQKHLESTQALVATCREECATAYDIFRAPRLGLRMLVRAMAAEKPAVPLEAIAMPIHDALRRRCCVYDPLRKLVMLSHGCDTVVPGLLVAPHGIDEARGDFLLVAFRRPPNGAKGPLERLGLLYVRDDTWTVDVQPGAALTAGPPSFRWMLSTDPRFAFAPPNEGFHSGLQLWSMASGTAAQSNWPTKCVGLAPLDPSLDPVLRVDRPSPSHEPLQWELWDQL